MAAWSAVPLVGAYELLMMIFRSAQTSALTSYAHEDVFSADPPGQRAAAVFATELAADRVPSIRATRAELRIGQPRAQRLRDYLAVGTTRRVEVPLREQHADRESSVGPRNRSALFNGKQGVQILGTISYKRGYHRENCRCQYPFAVRQFWPTSLHPSAQNNSFHDRVK